MNVDQSIALGGFQEMVRSAEPMLRSDAFGDVITALFDSLHGPLPDHEVARLSALRRPEQEVRARGVGAAARRWSERRSTSWCARWSPR